MKQSRIPDKYWPSSKGRYNSHAYFNTVSHHHISDYSGDASCDIMIVECADGRWYIEDCWCGDANGAVDVFNPCDKDSFPTFFDSLESANQRAAEIVSSITGCSIEQLIVEV